MFKWAASVRAQLSETFAPLLRTRLELLADAWNKVEQDICLLIPPPTSVLSDRELDDPKRLLESELVLHLNQLIETLVKEEEEQDGRDREDETEGDSAAGSAPNGISPTSKDGKSSTGPCFEYFLNQKIIHRLCVLGMADRPLGMRQLITKTVDAVLSNTRHPILPSMSVHQAVRQFLEVCFSKEDHKRRGYRSAFLSLLSTIAKKIKMDNSLAGIFFDYYPPKENRKPEFLLFTALCALMSESPVEGRTAYEALLWLAQIPNRDITDYIVMHTPYLTKTVESLNHLFNALPPPMERPMVEQLLQQSQSYPTIDNFFQRWRYCDAIMRSTYQPIQDELGRLISEQFLFGSILPLLLDQREAVASWTTDFVKHLALATESTHLRRVIIQFLLGSDDAPERVSEVEATSNESNKATIGSNDLRTILIKRLDSLSDTLCLHTLDLFQTLIGLRDPLVVNNLVVRNLLPLIPQPTSPISSLFSPTSPSTDPLSPSPLSSPLSSPLPSSPTVPSYVAFDILPIPQSVMFANFTDLPDFASYANFEEYLLDAQMEGQLWMQAWEDKQESGHVVKETEKRTDTQIEESTNANESEDKHNDSSSMPSSSSTSTSASSSTPSYEGLFLSTLFNKLESIYDNSFSTNLKLSAVLAKLSYSPSPILHEFLFNPDTRLLTSSNNSSTGEETSSGDSGASDARLLLHVLASIWNKGIKRASRMQNFSRRKEEVRQRLNAQMQQNNINNSTNNPTTVNGVLVETIDGERFFRGLILLEELLKELYAIAHTKARLFALQKLARLQSQANKSNHTTKTKMKISMKTEGEGEGEDEGENQSDQPIASSPTDHTTESHQPTGDTQLAQEESLP